MMRSVLLCLFLTALPYDLAAQVPPGSTGLACAEFLSNGNLLAARVEGAELQLEITTQPQNPVTLHLFLDQAESGRRLKVASVRWQSCTISVTSANQLAAVGVPVMVLDEMDSKKRAVFVAIVNLKTNQWGLHYLVGFNNKSLMFPTLVGFLGESEKLWIVTDSLYVGGTSESEIIDASTGEVENEKTVDVSQFAPVWRVFFDFRNSRVWVEGGHEKSKRHTLQAVSLLDHETLGPGIDLTKLCHERWLPDWGGVGAMAFPSAQTIVFAYTGASLRFTPNHLWIVDQSNGSVRVIDLLQDTGEVLLHGLGLTWFENVGSPAVLSPDGRFVAVPITLTTTGPPYIVDNYVSVGVRFVIVDLLRLRVLSSVTLKDARQPISSALNYRNGHVTLLVNANNVWKSMEFDVHE
jgi:hypothetical protein